MAAVKIPDECGRVFQRATTGWERHTADSVSMPITRKCDSVWISYHVEAAVKIDGQLEVIAMALMFSIPLSPKIADRCALEATVCEETNTVGKQRGDYGPADI
jgi:hypothetical protein